MYLAKIAMDILAKHKKADEKGVRIASLDEMTYRKELWNHTPITDFWRVGKGYKARLEKNRIYTMGDIARTSLTNQELLYKLFGVNAEILIDHAWGYEPVTMKDVKAFKPQVNSLSTGQVLHEPYDYEKTKLIVKEMMELLSLDLVSKNVVTNQLVLTIGYDISNINSNYKGEITMGLDNGVVVRSSKRPVTRDILPSELVYPFDREYIAGEVEIVYWRKNWNLRNAVLDSNAVFPTEASAYEFSIDTPAQVFELIKIIVSFMNKETWEDNEYGSTIWDYDEILPILQQNVMNLAIIASFMINNPDIYLIFYDSY